MDVNLEMRWWRKTKWQRGNGMSVGCGGVVIKHSPQLFAFQGFWETIPAICASLNSPTRLNGLQPGLSRNHSPCRSFIAAVCCYSPNNHRFLRHLSRLSNSYCTTITLVFSPRLVFSDISIDGSGTGCLLGWSFYYFSISYPVTM